MRFTLFFSCLAVILFSSCRESRIHEHADWGKHFEQYGIKKSCFILRDNNHEALHYYNKERCLERFVPASTFKIFNSLVALETAIAPDENLVIKWDSIKRRTECDTAMTMRDAFRISCLGYYQELARRIGPEYMQHYLDTVNYGNKNMNGALDMFWVNDTLQISADEQVGFLKRLYFAELPFSERSQRIVKSMMLREDTAGVKYYYKTGWAQLKDKQILWIVGFAEKVEKVKEHENSMNKAGERTYPYFYAMNFEIIPNDTTQNWFEVRKTIMHNVLNDYGFTKSVVDEK
jgi:Beta-lactamase class D